LLDAVALGTAEAPRCISTSERNVDGCWRDGLPKADQTRAAVCWWTSWPVCIQTKSCIFEMCRL